MSWLFPTIAWTLAAIALALLAWALFWDRARGRKRCPKCWYDMGGASPDEDGAFTCPECGRSIKTPRHLARTRRRWRFAALAVVLAIGASVCAAWPAWSQAQQRGWLSLIPTSIVIECLPMGGVDGPFGETLFQRMGVKPWRNGQFETTITDADKLHMVNRIATGNVLARPVSERWRRSYGALHQYDWKLGVTLPGRTGYVAESAEAGQAWLELPLELTARTRDKWPRTVPIHVQTDLEHYWPRTHSERASVRWSALETEESDSTHFRGHFTLPPGTAPGGIELDIDILAVPWNAETRRAEPDKAELVYTKSFRLEYELVDEVNDIMTPLESNEIDAILQQNFAFSYRERGGIMCDSSKTQSLLPADLAIGYRAEICHDGEPIGYDAVGSFSPNSYGSYRVYTEREREPARYIKENQDNGAWTVRITPEPEWAVRQLECARYWQGDIEVPLDFKAPLRVP